MICLSLGLAHWRHPWGVESLSPWGVAASVMVFLVVLFRFERTPRHGLRPSFLSPSRTGTLESLSKDCDDWNYQDRHTRAFESAPLRRPCQPCQASIPRGSSTEICAGTSSQQFVDERAVPLESSVGLVAAAACMLAPSLLHNSAMTRLCYVLSLMTK